MTAGAANASGRGDAVVEPLAAIRHQREHMGSEPDRAWERARELYERENEAGGYAVLLERDAVATVSALAPIGGRR